MEELRHMMPWMTVLTWEGVQNNSDIAYIWWLVTIGIVIDLFQKVEVPIWDKIKADMNAIKQLD